MKRILRPLTGAILAAAMGSASAGIVSFEDDNLDFHLRPDANGVLQPVTAGDTNLLSGDVLIAVLEFNTANGVAFEPDRELTGIAVIQATSDGGAFVFSPYEQGFNAAVNTFAGTPVNVFGGEAGGGAMLALWLDDDPNLDVDASLVNTAGGFSCSTLGICLDQSSDGVIYEVDGFEEGDNSYWTALSTETDTNVVLVGPVTEQFGFYNAGLSILDVGTSNANDNGPFNGSQSGNGGLPVDVLLSGTINGGGFNEYLNVSQRDSMVASGFVATTDTQLQKEIPVPAPLALFGLGLLGFAFSKRRLT